VQVILATVDEVVPQEGSGRILSFGTCFLHVYVLLLERDQVSVFLNKQAWNFTSCQHGVASFKERFILNFGISQDEGNSTTLWTCAVVEFLNILLELRITVGFVESDLEEGLSANE